MLIFVFGDSIAYGAWDKKGGWVARLREQVDSRNISDPDFYGLVYNLGISGDTTEGVLERFEVELERRLKDDLEEEVIVIFAIGINDSQYIYKKKGNKVPLSKFKSNLKQLILKAKRYAKGTIFVGLTPVDEARVVPLPWDKRKCYKNEYVEKYDKEIEKIAASEGVEYVKIRDLFPKERVSELLFDGLHPNDKGHELIYKRVLKYIFK